MSAEKDAMDVIVLDDDDCDVIDLVGKAMQGNSKCINYACESGSDMITAPVFCLSYYRVKKKNRKGCVICMECYNNALKFYDNMAVCLVKGDKLVEVDVPFRNDLVEIEDSDEETTDTADVTLSENDIPFIDNNIDDILLDMIDKYKVKEQAAALDVKLQDDVKQFEQSLHEQCDVIKQLRKDFDSMCIGLYNKFTYNHHHLTPLEITDNVEDKKQFEMKLDKKNDVVISNIILIEEPKNFPKDGKFTKPLIVPGEIYYASQNKNGVVLFTKVKVQRIINTADHKQTYEVAILNTKQTKQTVKIVTGKELAYSSPAPVKLLVGTRVIAVFTFSNIEASAINRNYFYPGVVGEAPSAFNNFRYLVFFDDGYAHYVQHNAVYPVVESSKDVWDDINVEARAFIKKYLNSYPDRPMVKFKKNQKVSTEYNGQWHATTVLNIDCSLVKVSFDQKHREEWIYRGSTRLRPLYNVEQAATNRLQNNKRTPRLNTNTSSSTPYVQYTNDDQQQPQRAVARKSTAKLDQNQQQIKAAENIEKDFKKSKIVYYTPKRQKPNTQLFKQHTCSPKCRDLISCSIKRLVAYNPLAKPLLCGFHRLLYKYKSRKHIVYKAPCGRILRNMPELHKYLWTTKSVLTVDFFNFEVHIRCLAEYFLDDDIQLLNKDLSAGQEEVPITVVNYIDNTLIDFCNYSTKRQPMEGVNLNLDPNFLCGCDCEDDCADKEKCSCWKLTLEGMKYWHQGNDVKNIGYSYRRLVEPVHTGIYECNERCKCAPTCLNRVVQNPLQHKLQVFKTAKRGWGIRCINDIPLGAFICIYAGALLTEQMANEGGQCYGDEYLAELDYIEVVEKMKEDYEADVTEDTASEKAPSVSGSEASIPSADSEDDAKKKSNDYEYDRDFIVDKRKINFSDNSMRAKLRKRNDDKSSNSLDAQDDTVTISDDDDDAVQREPSSFNPKSNPELDESENSNSVRTLYGKNENVYIMDAKSTGNIGRFLNHSCSPNVFVQNVFVDTHDPRFPWVAFFAMSYIRAGTELTWNYQYDVGSVPGKILVCRCESSECKGRLL